MEKTDVLLNKEEVKQESISGNGNKANKLFKLLENNSWKLLVEGGKLGVKGVKRFFTIVLLFVFTNLILFTYAISRVYITGIDTNKVLFVLLTLGIGLGVTIYAWYQTYQFVIIETIRAVYDHLSVYFKKISDHIIDRVEPLFLGKAEVSNNQISKALDFGNLINSKFKKIPKLLRRGIIYILNQVPLVDIIIDLREDIQNGDKEEASSKLFEEINEFITDIIFGDNDTQWVWWLLPLNIAVVLVIVYFKIG